MAKAQSKFCKSHLYIIGLFLSLFTLDALMKFSMIAFDIDYLPIFTTPFGIDFALQYAINRGGAWGMLSSYSTTLLVFRLFVIALVFTYLIRHRESRKMTLALGLIITGALGNVIDSFVYGHVIDMMHFTFWGRSYGIFNIADAMIFLGCISLTIIFMRKPKEPNEGKSEGK